MIQQDAHRIHEYLVHSAQGGVATEDGVLESLGLTRDEYQRACKLLERAGSIEVDITSGQRPYIQIKLPSS
jgi:hypothetical protein